MSKNLSCTLRCYKCKSPLEPDQFFCGECGRAHIENIVVKNRSTADYDPTNVLYKPWREKINLIGGEYEKISIKSRKLKPKFVNSIPWKPTLRNNKPPRKIIKQQLVEINKDINIDKSSFEEDVDFSKLEGVCFFHGRPFMKAEKYYKSSKAVNSSLMFQESENSEGIKEVLQLYEKTYPLSIYECYWIQCQRSILCHVGLLEMFNGKRRSSFLRIGITLSDLQQNSDEENILAANSIHYYRKNDAGAFLRTSSTNGDDLLELEILSNDVGRLMSPNKISWVDLFAISPQEPYILSYVEESYNFLARRVQWSNLFWINYLVSLVFIDLHQNVMNAGDIELALLSPSRRNGANQSLLQGKYQRQFSKEEVLQHVCDCYCQMEGQESLFLYFDRCALTFSRQIHLGKFYLMKFVPCQYHHISLGEEYQGESIVPSTISALTLMILPYNYEFDSQAHILSFSRQSVEKLCEIPNLDEYILAGKASVYSIGKKLCSLLSFQMCSHGLLPILNGCFNDFTSFSASSSILWDYFDDLEYEEEDENENGEEEPSNALSQDTITQLLNEEQDDKDLETIIDEIEANDLISSSIARKYENIRREAAAIKMQSFLRMIGSRCRVQKIRNERKIGNNGNEEKLEEEDGMEEEEEEPFLCPIHQSCNCPCLMVERVIQGSTLLLVVDYYDITTASQDYYNTINNNNKYNNDVSMMNGDDNEGMMISKDFRDEKNRQLSMVDGLEESWKLSMSIQDTKSNLSTHIDFSLRDICKALAMLLSPCSTSLGLSQAQRQSPENDGCLMEILLTKMGSINVFPKSWQRKYRLSSSLQEIQSLLQEDSNLYHRDHHLLSRVSMLQLGASLSFESVEWGRLCSLIHHLFSIPSINVALIVFLAQGLNVFLAREMKIMKVKFQFPEIKYWKDLIESQKAR